jgi:hypothetical protein
VRDALSTCVGPLYVELLPHAKFCMFSLVDAPCKPCCCLQLVKQLLNREYQRGKFYLLLLLLSAMHGAATERQHAP